MRKKSMIVTGLLAVVLLSSCASLMLSISDPDWHKVQGSMYAKTDPLSGEVEIRDYMTLGHSNEFALYIKMIGDGAPTLMADAYYQTGSPGNLGLIESVLVYDADDNGNRVDVTFNPHATQYDVGNGWWSAYTTGGHIDGDNYATLYAILQADKPAMRLTVTDGITTHIIDRDITRNANYRALKVMDYYYTVQ